MAEIGNKMAEIWKKWQTEELNLNKKLQYVDIKICSELNISEHRVGEG
jgi:hypothetical protein